MTPSRPYLLRAMYDWISDNGLTPHILVNAAESGVQVPHQHVQDGKIILNVNAQAARHLRIGNDRVEMEARFGGVATPVSVPLNAVLAIYARENGQGMVFNEEAAPPPPAGPEKPDTKPGKPKLKLVT
ncbi:MAG: ClpXP protease specificity-enhancing factor [Gammaproteobacteria bacterium]|nr:MAG: ClpXP protease specificity-enhancing factor [Gammaproteobacteria bacterium]